MEFTLTTTCEVTVTPTEGLSEPFNAKEKCKNRKDGFISPDNLKGTVKLDGLVDNTKFPELTFDPLWTIKHKEKKRDQKAKDPAPTEAPGRDDGDGDDVTLPPPETEAPVTAPTGNNRPPTPSDDD